MGSWCAASKHPWRHAQKFRGILQPRHLARVCCSKAETRELLAVSDESLLQAGELLLSPWSASLCLQAVEELLGALGLQAVLPLPVPLQCPQSVLPRAVVRQHEELAQGSDVRSISLPSCESVQCRPLSLVSPGALGTCPGLDQQPHPRMSQLSAGSQHPGDSRWDTAAPFSSSGLEQCGLWHVRSYL